MNQTKSDKGAPPLIQRDNTRPAFTPLRPEIPLELRPRIKIKTERRSIILDPFHPRDLRELNLIFCCEQCSYYNLKKRACAMGFKVEMHTRENQLKLYQRTGKMALCRSLEVD